MATNQTAVSGAEQQRELLAVAGRVLAGGGLGLFNLPDEVNLVIAEGKGSHVIDVAGREYIDYHLGSGPDLLGHAHPAITEAVSAQLAKGSTYYFLNAHAIRLAERIVGAVPCGEQLHFTGSGTEATFFARRVARAHTAGLRRGFPTQALGEDAVFGIRFIENNDVKNWRDLQAHDKALGLRWGVECLKRGLLVNPNEKFYVSLAHTEADIDRTLEICDAAFAAVQAG